MMTSSQRWYHELLEHVQEDAPGAVWQLDTDSGSGAITPDTCERYLVLQRDGEQEARYQSSTIPQLETLLANLVDEWGWYVAEVWDLEEGKELGFTVSVKVVELGAAGG